MNTIKFIIENWYFIIAAFAIIGAVYLGLRWFLSLPNTEKKRRIISWMIYAVKLAEDRFGSGTGVIKLGMVYDMFVKKYSFISKVITYEQFKSWVDEALALCEKALADSVAKQ